MDGANSFRYGALIAVMLTSLADPAFADNCRDRVLELAAQYKIETEPPTIPPGEMRKPVTPEDLARSGGVVEPGAVLVRAIEPAVHAPFAGRLARRQPECPREMAGRKIASAGDLRQREPGPLPLTEVGGQFQAVLGHRWLPTS